MPRGRYVHADPLTGEPAAVEEFDCAAGPAGWRYVATVGPAGGGPPTNRVDVTLDSAGRQIRVELTGGGWLLRGGVAGAETVWVRSGLDTPPSPLDQRECSERATGFSGRSPAFLLAAARLLRHTCRVAPGERHVLRVVEVHGGALAARAVDQAWRLVGVDRHDTEAGTLPVQRWEVDDLAAGTRRAVDLAGDVLVAAPDVELTALTGPPTFDR